MEVVDIMTCNELVLYLIEQEFSKKDVIELESKLCNAMPANEFHSTIIS